MAMSKKLAAEFVGTFGLVLGGCGTAVLHMIAGGQAGLDPSGGFASNGYGEPSPGGYSTGSGLVTEIVMTFMFPIIIMGAILAGAVYRWCEKE